MGERRDLRDLLRDTDFEQRRIIDDLSNYKGDQYDRDIAGDIKRGGASDFFKNVFVGLFLIAIVIGSFWVSFLVGKRVLVPPIKNIPTIEFPKALSPVNVNKTETSKPQAEEKPVAEEDVNEVAEKPQTTTAKTITLVASQTVKYYKVIAGSFAVLSDAQNMTKKLSQKGFGCYLKKIANVWRVQVGAFKTSKEAQTQVARLKAKGFSSKVIAE